MKSDRLKFALCLLFFVALALVTFRCAWPADQVFSASDLNIGRLASKKNCLPEMLTGYFTGNQVMGSSGVGLTLFNVLLALLPLTVFANVIYGLILVGSSMALVWFLRIWNRSWMASVFGALVAFWFNSITLAAAGHAYKLEVLALSVLSLCFIEKAIRACSLRRVIGLSVVGGLSVGTMIIEQQDVALLAGLFVASYAVFRLVQIHGKSVSRWIALLLPIGVVALLLSGSTVVKSYQVNIASASSIHGGSEEKWNYITQWSLVPGEWPDLVASGWSGWSTGNPEGPYWGKMGRSAEWETLGQGFRNFKLTSIYIGLIPFLFGAFGAVHAFRNRKTEEARGVLFWSVAALISLGLAFGKYSILYKLFYQLPMVNNIRVPIKFLDNFQICLGIVSAYGLDRLIASGRGSIWTKVFWLVSSLCGGVLLLAGSRLLLFPAAQEAEFAKMGYGASSETMVRNMSHAWFHAALLALVCAGLVFVVWKRFKQAKWIATVFVAVLACDSLALTSHYFRADDISSLKRGNVLINFLKENQENERTFFVDQGGIYNLWLASDGPYNGLNLFNIWQMPRMPVDYEKFLTTVGRSQIRLWELSAIRYIAAPAGILQELTNNPTLGQLFEPVMSYQVPTAQGMRPDVLLRFKGAIPRFALYRGWEAVPLDAQCERLVSPLFNPRTSVLVAPGSGLATQQSTNVFQPVAAKVTLKTATLSVQTDSPAVLRFAQHYQPGWTAYVDGQRAELLCVDYLCMGVKVPAGNHQVEFRCINGRFQFTFVIAVLVASSLLAAVLLGGWRRNVSE